MYGYWNVPNSAPEFGSITFPCAALSCTETGVYVVANTLKGARRYEMMRKTDASN